MSRLDWLNFQTITLDDEDMHRLELGFEVFIKNKNTKEIILIRR